MASCISKYFKTPSVLKLIETFLDEINSLESKFRLNYNIFYLDIEEVLSDIDKYIKIKKIMVDRLRFLEKMNSI